MKDRCSFCSRPATKLCDAPVGRSYYVGHPPRSLVEAGKMRDVYWKKVDNGWVRTCDKPICDRCAVSIAPEIDYCPDCVRRIKMAAAQKRKE